MKNYISVKGDHFIYFYGNLPENINIHSSGNMAKPYQVKQIRNYLVKNAEIVIGEWIEIAKERGQKIPEPKGRLLYA